MSFIRGVFGYCEQCGSELNLRTDVRRVAKLSSGYAYHSRCPFCSAANQTAIDREVHLAGVAYLRQVVADKAAATNILEPLNPLENELLDFGHFLEEATTEVIWAELESQSL